MAAVTVTALLGTTLLAACGDDEVAPAPAGPASSAGSEPSTVTSSDASPVASDRCDALVSDAVVSGLGWSADGTVGESVGRCEWTGSGDVLTVGERTDLAAGGGEDAQAAYDQACSALGEEAGGTLDADTTWLDGDGCLKEAGAETGVSTLYLLTDDRALVEVRVVAATPTSVDELRAGLGELASNVEAEL